MADDDDPRVIVLMRFRSPFDRRIPDSKVMSTDCGHEGWLSPQGQEFMAAHPQWRFALRCWDCRPPDAPGDKHYTVPGTFEVTQQCLPPAARETFRRQMQEFGVEEWPEQ